MKCGTPVIAGNRTSIPEVAGEAALLFDPFEVNSLVAALKRILNDSDLRAELSAKGLQRASRVQLADNRAVNSRCIRERPPANIVNQCPLSRFAISTMRIAILGTRNSR